MVSSSGAEGGEGGGSQTWDREGGGSGELKKLQKIVAGGPAGEKFCAGAHGDARLAKRWSCLCAPPGENFGFQSDRCPESIDFGWFHCSGLRGRGQRGGGVQRRPER